MNAPVDCFSPRAAVELTMLTGGDLRVKPCSDAVLFSAVSLPLLSSSLEYCSSLVLTLVLLVALEGSPQSHFGVLNTHIYS